MVTIVAQHFFRSLTLLALLPTLCLMPGCPGPGSAAAPVPLFKRDVSGGIHDIAPVRSVPAELALHRDGDAFACSSCHEGFDGDMGQLALEDEHKDISFDHGANASCLNCHSPKNSDAYVDYAGNDIPGNEPTKLCAKCHGPQFREWENGIHGRTNGHWNAKFGEQIKLDCTQCHDPHKPRFAQMVPLHPPRLTRFDPEPEGTPRHAK